jgi:hypothetical protein
MPASMNIVCFGCRGTETNDASLKAANVEIMLRLQEHGIATPSDRTVRDQRSLRAIIAPGERIWICLFEQSSIQGKNLKGLGPRRRHEGYLTLQQIRAGWDAEQTLEHGGEDGGIVVAGSHRNAGHERACCKRS